MPPKRKGIDWSPEGLARIASGAEGSPRIRLDALPEDELTRLVEEFARGNRGAYLWLQQAGAPVLQDRNRVYVKETVNEIVHRRNPHHRPHDSRIVDGVILRFQRAQPIDSVQLLTVDALQPSQTLDMEEGSDGVMQYICRRFTYDMAPFLNLDGSATERYVFLSIMVAGGWLPPHDAVHVFDVLLALEDNMGYDKLRQAYPEVTTQVERLKRSPDGLPKMQVYSGDPIPVLPWARSQTYRTGDVTLPGGVTLSQLMVDRMSMDEVMDLYFKLGVRYDCVPGSTVSVSVRELILYMQRHDRYNDLVKAIEYEFPHVLR